MSASHRWIAVAPLAAKEVLRALVYDPEGRTRFVRREWPWQFHGGKSYTFDTAHGAQLIVIQQTVFGCLVIAVVDDREGLAARIEEDCALRGIPLEDVAALTRRFDGAATDRDRVQALLALTAAQAAAGPTVLPALDAAIRRALDDRNPVVRLTAIRATALLPETAVAHALLATRTDPDNPGLTDWRDHYRTLLDRGHSPGS